MDHYEKAAIPEQQKNQMVLVLIAMMAVLLVITAACFVLMPPDYMKQKHKPQSAIESRTRSVKPRVFSFKHPTR